MVEKSLKIGYFNRDAAEAHAPGGRGAKTVVERQVGILSEAALSLGAAGDLFDCEGHLVGNAQAGKSQSLDGPEFYLNLKDASGPERIDRPAPVTNLPADLQSGDGQTHAECEQQPLSQKPQEQGQCHQGQRWAPAQHGQRLDG